MEELGRCPLTERRRFNSGERVALYLTAKGKCSLCGIKLTATWEPDHVEPYSKGGATDVVNGQALCRPCNRRKGNSVDNFPEIKLPEGFIPFDWQDQAMRKWEQYIKSDDPTLFLAAVTPGAGKTNWALMVASLAFKKGWIDRLVVVVPTGGLTEQWADEAAKFGINIDPDWKNAFGEEHEENDKEWHGIAITYHSLTSEPTLHRTMCTNRQTMVILDEVHHCGDNKSWGKKTREAFEPAVIRIGLSGTPFRKKGSIPWVEYDKDGISEAHYTYSHGEAIADGVNIPVAFPTQDGFTEWSEDGKVFSAWLSDDTATLKQQARRRNVAIDPELDWIASVIQDADEKITEARASGDPTAALIIFCKDQKSAKDLADKYTNITGYDAVLVTSDVHKAREKIDSFRDGTQRCIICVEMVSEGVDIPRLRAAIYATNKRESLGFLQKVGRVIRPNRDLPADVLQLAYFYIPKEADLIAKAESIMDMRDHILEEDDDIITCPGPDDEEDDYQPSGWDALSATGEVGGLVYDGEKIRQECYARAQGMRQEDDSLARAVTDGQVALVLERLATEGRLPEMPVPESQAKEPTTPNGSGTSNGNTKAKFRRKRDVTTYLDVETKGLTTDRLIRALNGDKVSREEWGRLFQDEIRNLRYELGDEVGAWGDSRTEDQKSQQLELVKKWRKRERNG